jgi:putative FmdB family regulatory protein
MPTIPYQCDNCDHYFEITQGYHDKRKKKCPQCKKNKLYQVFCAPVVSVPKSIGSLAEKNTHEMGKYKFDKLEKEQKDRENAVKLENLKKAGVVKPEATELPDQKTWYNPTGENLNKKLKKVLTDKKKTKEFIEKGTT